mmetsp:Transcript_3229/g.9852  ORF Transcript_3229/g.9852 Transcript_3229/m.9852 type:complete len:433 (-) Transcript_3229:233-1531(-)
MTSGSIQTTVTVVGPAAAGIVPVDLNKRGTRNERAPRNVFTRTVNLSAGCDKEWTNYYELPVEYTVECYRGLFAIGNDTLATRFMPENGLRRRFLVVDDKVDELYGKMIRQYFDHYSVSARIVVIPGEEENKRFEMVDRIFEELCDFGLHRREPIVAVGGGVVLDIVGFTASLYRRGVPYIRVPTTLLAIVDASVGVKTGVDYVSKKHGPLKNRMGAFYAPCAAFLDKSFIATQDERNIVNGLCEIMKLALVRSRELFQLLEDHGPRVIAEKFQGADGVADRIIELGIQLMLEELGPNLWEYKLERCVDYGHSFSKIIEMVAEPALMHGEAVNVDGFFCVVLSHRRRLISTAVRDRIMATMHAMKLPTYDKSCTIDVMWQGLLDAVEHRHGKQRLPLITNVGEYTFANDVSIEELREALVEFEALHDKRMPQ